MRSYVHAITNFHSVNSALTKLCHIKHDYLVHIICAKCPPSAKTSAFRRLRKSLIDHYVWQVTIK